MNRSWLDRLAFSFLIIGSFLAWEGYQSAVGRRGHVSTGRIILYFTAAMLSFVLFVVGVRQRHRRD